MASHEYFTRGVKAAQSFDPWEDAPTQHELLAKAGLGTASRTAELLAFNQGLVVGLLERVRRMAIREHVRARPKRSKAV